MLPLIRRIGLGRLGAVLAAVLCLGTMTTFPKPAEARVWVGVNFGYPGYYYAPSYYYPAYYPSYGYGYYPRHRYWRHQLPPRPLPASSQVLPAPVSLLLVASVQSAASDNPNGRR